MKVLGHVIRKEFLQLRRDRKMIPILVAVPILQLVIFGYAANLDVNQLPMVLVDGDHTQASRELVGRFTGSGYFRLVAELDDAGAVDRELTRGPARLALVIAPGYGDDVASGRTPAVQVIADGSEGNLSLLGLNYASSVIRQKSSELVAARFRALGGNGPRFGAVGQIELVPRIWYNPDLRSRWYFVPAILAMVLMMTTMVLPAMAVVREKEIGTLEQIMVTPVKPWQLIMGKLFPFAAIGLVTILMVTALAVYFLGVPLRGSLLLLFLLTALFQLSTLGLGLLASTVVRNQQQAMLVSIFLLQVPMIYLSGLIFPIENMPRVIQYATYAIPLRYYNTVVRGIFLKGSGIGILWPQALILLAYGAAILALASGRFRKRLD